MLEALDLGELETELQSLLAQYRAAWKRTHISFEKIPDDWDERDRAIFRLLREQAMAEGTPAPTTQPAEPNRAGDDISAGLGRSRPR